MVYVKAWVAEAAAEEPRRLLRSETVTLERAGWEKKKKKIKLKNDKKKRVKREKEEVQLTSFSQEYKSVRMRTAL